MVQSALKAEADPVEEGGSINAEQFEKELKSSLRWACTPPTPDSIHHRSLSSAWA
jgi:hypothetical protein